MPPIENALAFPGQWRDIETGLCYNWNRYYVPGLGRYLQPDPLGYAASPGDLYSYAAANPVMCVDPDGQIVFAIVGAWALTEFALSAYDVYDAIRTLLDECASTETKLWSIGGTLAGVLLPGGGYGKLGKEVGERLVKHHVFPRYLAKRSGIRQQLLRMPESLHNALHADMNRYFKEFYPHLVPKRGYPGELIRGLYPLSARLDAVGAFYRGSGAKYTEAARAFVDLLIELKWR